MRKKIVEDAYPVGDYEIEVRHALRHFAEQHDYDGPSWGGVEKFHLHLSAVVYAAAVQSAGWYKYPGSTRQDMDGKDWRLIIESGDGRHICVNCHSLLHDGVWTLSTTIFTTDQVEPLGGFIGNEDAWLRSMLWSYWVAEVLETDGYDYTSAKEDMKSRMYASEQVWEFVDELRPQVEDACMVVLGEPSELTDFTVAVNDWNLPERKVGAYKHPGEFPWAMLTVNPAAWERDGDFVRFVVMHELIHGCLGSDDPEHNDKFEAVADYMGLPEEYQD